MFTCGVLAQARWDDPVKTLNSVNCSVFKRELLYGLRGGSQVTRLCDLSCDGDSVTSVSWSERVSSS